MKKVRLILAASACCLAGAGVFASSMVVTNYFQVATAGVISCSTAYTGTVCPAGNTTQCKVLVGDNELFITKKVDAQPCALHMRN